MLFALRFLKRCERLLVNAERNGLVRTRWPTVCELGFCHLQKREFGNNCGNAGAILH